MNETDITLRLLWLRVLRVLLCILWRFQTPRSFFWVLFDISQLQLNYVSLQPQSNQASCKDFPLFNHTPSTTFYIASLRRGVSLHRGTSVTRSDARGAPYIELFAHLLRLLTSYLSCLLKLVRLLIPVFFVQDWTISAFCSVRRFTKQLQYSWWNIFLCRRSFCGGDLAGFVI